jgi:hypothetical protein
VRRVWRRAGHVRPLPSCGRRWLRRFASCLPRFAGANTLAMMNSLAWGWLLCSLDTTGRPLFSVGGSDGSFNAMGGSDNAGYDMRGTMLGCNVIVSGNVPTNLGGGSNETRVVAMRADDQFLWEDRPRRFTSAPSSRRPRRWVCCSWCTAIRRSRLDGSPRALRWSAVPA